MMKLASCKVYHLVLIAVIHSLFFMLSAQVVMAADSVCAVVKIEIKQELTLERQAFDASMVINNGLENVSLDHVSIDVKFSDSNGNPVLATSDPNDTSASFFIRVDRMEGITDINGSGVIGPKSNAEIHWLIIPAPGSAKQQSLGTLYLVGANLRYNLGGEEQVTQVTPDSIYVKPLPKLSLDYFLTRDVYGDNPFTQAIEVSENFTLGVRVRNNGQGVAKNLKIDSAQPKIVDNEQGLLIGFRINGSYIGDTPANNSLLINFGDIPPSQSKIGRWILESSLSGKFIDISARFSHSDDLGGQLTSLIDQINTHLLIRDVRVDLPGRDKVRDFLALDGDTLRAYESNGVDTLVNDQSNLSHFNLLKQDSQEVLYQLEAPVTAGLMYVKFPDPYQGKKVLRSVTRADGKQIAAENTWLSKTRNGSHLSYAFNLFDSNTKSQYLIEFTDPAIEPHAPVIQFIPDRSVKAGNQISFIVEASDPDGTIPSIHAAPLPVGAKFTDNAKGVAIFDWTPTKDQTGDYVLSYQASDGVLSSQRSALITVLPGERTNQTVHIDLQPGFNLIGYPVEPAAEHQSCAGFLNSLGDASMAASISRYNVISQNRETCRHDNQTDFAIKAGDTLEILMLKEKSFDLTGLKSCPQWLLGRGPNYLSHPSAQNLTCFDLLQHTQGKVSSLQKFDTATGRFEYCAWLDGKAVGNNYPITPALGLIVNSTSQQVITLPGCE